MSSLTANGIAERSVSALSGANMTAAGRGPSSATGNHEPIYLNGRFRIQALTGVQRYALEITRALDLCWPPDRNPLTMLVPTEAGADSPFRSIVLRRVGRLRGHAWEQIELPLSTRGGLLVNFGNVGPVALSRQIVVMHDTSVFSTPCSYARQYRWWHKTLQLLLARRHVGILTPTRFSRDEISRHLRVPATSIGVIGAGADHAVRQEADHTILARHDLKPGGFVVAVGSLAPHKNLQALGLTCERLHELGVELVITGGINRRIFNEQADLPQPARYIGRVNDAELRGLYEGAACSVLPSLYEGLGFPVLEAMMCGCPVVASTAGSLPEICGDAAILVDASSQQAIAEAVCRLIGFPAAKDALRLRGRAHAARYTWAETASKVLAHIQARLNG